jgi:hypothetical protein
MSVRRSTTTKGNRLPCGALCRHGQGLHFIHATNEVLSDGERGLAPARPIHHHVVTQLLPFVGYPHTLNGLRAIDEITASMEHREQSSLVVPQGGLRDVG